MYIGNASSKLDIKGCVFTYPRDSIKFTYAGDDVYSVIPHLTHLGFISSPISVVVTTGIAGATITATLVRADPEKADVDLGQVSAATPNTTILQSFGAPTVYPGDSISFVPSDQSVRFTAAWDQGYQNASDTRALHLAPTATNVLIDGCQMLSKSTPVFIEHSPNLTYMLNRCYIKSVEGSADITTSDWHVLNAYNCTFGGGGPGYYFTAFAGEGTATISENNTSVVISHRVGSTPRNIQVTPTADIGQRSFWISDITKSTFKLNINGDPAGVGGLSFNWVATK